MRFAVNKKAVSLWELRGHLYQWLAEQDLPHIGTGLHKLPVVLLLVPCRPIAGDKVNDEGYIVIRRDGDNARGKVKRVGAFVPFGNLDFSGLIISGYIGILVTVVANRLGIRALDGMSVIGRQHCKGFVILIDHRHDRGRSDLAFVVQHQEFPIIVLAILDLKLFVDFRIEVAIEAGIDLLYMASGAVHVLSMYLMRLHVCPFLLFSGLMAIGAFGRSRAFQ